MLAFLISILDVRKVYFSDGMVGEPQAMRGGGPAMTSSGSSQAQNDCIVDLGVSLKTGLKQGQAFDG